MVWTDFIPAGVILYLGLGALTGMAWNSYAVSKGSSPSKAEAQGLLVIPVWPVMVATVVVVGLVRAVVWLFVTAFRKED